MKVRTLILLIVFSTICAFVALNWPAFTAPSTLSLGITDVQAPLGLVMIGVVGVLTALFLVFVVYLQTSVLLETRRQAQEMQTNRKLADKAEASRFTELRAFLDTDLKRQSSQDEASKAALLARLDLLEQELRRAVEQSGNTLAAFIGELEDRLEKGPNGLKPLPPA